MPPALTARMAVPRAKKRRCNVLMKPRQCRGFISRSKGIRRRVAAGGFIKKKQTRRSGAAGQAAGPQRSSLTTGDRGWRPSGPSISRIMP